MYWRIQPHLTACFASGRLVLLDLARDRYLLLPASAMAGVQAWLEARDGAPPSASVRLALGEALRSPGPAPDNRAVTVVDIPPGLATARAEAGPLLPTAAAVAAQVLASWASLRALPLGAVLARHRGVRTRNLATTRVGLAARSAQFARVRPFCPISRNCLLDSLSLDRWLGIPGNVRLVLGVTADPFEAHCWLQSQTAILGDSFDRVSRFRAILAL